MCLILTRSMCKWGLAIAVTVFLSRIVITCACVRMLGSPIASDGEKVYSGRVLWGSGWSSETNCHNIQARLDTRKGHRIHYNNLHYLTAVCLVLDSAGLWSILRCKLFSTDALLNISSVAQVQTWGLHTSTTVLCWFWRGQLFALGQVKLKFLFHPTYTYSLI